MSELLRDNLYEFSEYNRSSNDDPYFTLPRLRLIAKQVAPSLGLRLYLKKTVYILKACGCTRLRGNSPP